MRVTMVTGVGETAVVEVPEPVLGPKDVLVKIKACGICGSDGFYVSIGGIPPRQGSTPLGHEPAGEVVAVGADVEGIPLGAHVVINPMAAPSGIIGNGGASGALSDHLLVENAVLGTSLAVVPDHIPYEVAALNEPMAVARHAVNRTKPGPGSKVVVFGAGPIGLGAAIGYKSLGAKSVVVIDVIPSRLEKALAVGADGVIDSSREDVLERLIELHGEGPSRRGKRKPATDIFLDAAGAPAVITTALEIAKFGATLGVVAVHKKPVEIDLGDILSAEVTIVMAMGYPSEIFEVTDDIVANWQKYQLIISDRFPFERVQDALVTAATPGAADKVVVTFD